eukprot:TRINITY_DN5512_c0_g1_i1.p1 TRINITY_DN5512_c0_g1~~TRINITY_DN5512_c0_g1_i1.p1  ORF type:complete len:478 (+),score=206.67 TRINITY_DN5512_c0_g1_i1:29-1435(+)
MGMTHRCLAVLLAVGACCASDVLPQKDTFVYIAPRHVPGVAIPGRNATLVSLPVQLSGAGLPDGWHAVNIRADAPKYLVKGHHHDLDELVAAYGADLVPVPGTSEFFVLATYEVEVRKAHSCGSMLIKPFPHGDGSGAASRIPPKGSEPPRKPLGASDADKKAAMEKVNSADIESILRKLGGEDKVLIDGVEQLIPTRYSFVEWNLKVAEWIGEWLKEEAGCDDLQYQEFKVKSLLSTSTTRNVICVRNGTETPEKVAVIGAHFDSISSANGGNSKTNAPGAIDNGSGTTNVMAIAKALKSFRFKKTVHFILFSGEEQGLYGSTHYVDQVVERGEQDNIAAAFIMDMTGYSSKYFGVTIEGTKDASIQLLMTNAKENTEFLRESLGTEMTLATSDDSFGSDHVPFQRAGIPAVLHIEQDDTDYPSYHRTTDKCENANYDQMRDIARVIMAQLLDYSGGYIPAQKEESL